MADEFNEIVYGLKRRLELMRASGLKEVMPFKITLEGLKTEALSCVKCGPVAGKKAVIFGSGESDPVAVFVGGAPGPQEEAEGGPFAGEEGALLKKIIKAMGLDEEDVYLCYAVKCLTDDGVKDPDEAASKCATLLIRQIKALSPKVVVALGPLPSFVLAGSTDVKDLRGRFLDLNGIKLVSTYDPATLIKDPALKKYVWDDMKMVSKELGKNLRA